MKKKIKTYDLKKASRIEKFQRLFGADDVFNIWLNNQGCTICWEKVMNILKNNQDIVLDYFGDDAYEMDEKLFTSEISIPKYPTKFIYCQCEDLEKKINDEVGEMFISSQMCASRCGDNIAVVINILNTSSLKAKVMVINTSIANAQYEIDTLEEKFQCSKYYCLAIFENCMTIIAVVAETP